jgi:peptidoglycan hydrolase-like protein with peptidoglycan-binding domain
MARLRPRLRPLIALVAGLAVLATGAVAAYAAQRRDDATIAAPPSSEAPTTTEATTTTTVAPTTEAPTTTEAPVPALRRGDGGPEVEALQQRLFALGYHLPALSGTYDDGTAHAVMAFQKLHGLARDGLAGPQTMAALATAGPVEPRYGAGPHLEVDLAAQVLVVVDGRGGAVAVDATTGKASTPTPPGTFAVFRQVDGWDPGPYGSLYRPKYFNGGIAVHGGPPVIADPASHGCVRIPDAAIDWLWASGLAAPGTSVVVA